MRDFVGNERFQVISRLGSGGMGAVYHVLDRERSTRMALKTVGTVDGEALLRFKREYRALQDLDHPNLIQLGELFEVDGEWFYTMELIDGTSFLRWVRPNDRALDGNAPKPRRPNESGPDDATHVPPQEADDVTSDAGPSPLPGFDELRLRRSLAQLASGLAALHASGKVHRDIKPSNVLVDEQGRVVLLDFGLVAELRRGEQRSDVGVMGTFPYMSPEQALGRAVGPAADWYAVGTMLFQALTGQLPFRGDTEAVLYAKVHEEAPEARSIDRRVPADLSALARDLLRRNADDRPGPREILERLHVEGDDALGRSSYVSSSVGVAFVGRDAELEVLRRAFTGLLEQRGSAIVVTGQSGIGKSELVRRFLDDIEDRYPSAVVLTGRCYERESVPFRSFDGIVDALSGHLARLPRDRVERLVPRHRGLVARVFPVLRRVEAMRDDGEPDVPDPQEKRARLFGAFRSLFSRLASGDPVVLCIEDLQWIDEDSRALIEEILREPASPPLMFLATRRSVVGDETNRPDQAILRSLRAESLDIDRLSDEEARTLAARLLRDETGERRARIEAIVREAQGHPLLLDQLAHHASSRADVDGDVGSLESAVRERIAGLPASIVRTLALICVAEAPIALGVLTAATGNGREACEAAVRELRSLRLIRTNGLRETDLVEAFHGRIAATVLADLDETTRVELHAALAFAMDGAERSDPVALARHFAGAGQPRRAAVCAARAAKAAADVLAFDRAATMYRRSIELHPDDSDELGDRLVELARSLANAGRGKEAAETFLRAAEDPARPDVIDLRRRAAEQFLLSGHVSLGIGSLRGLLINLGIAYPDTYLRAIVSILVVRLWLLLRNHRYEERDAASISVDQRLRLETCHSAALGLTATDTIRGLDFYGRSYRIALELGDRSKIAQLLATESMNRIANDGAGRRKAWMYLRRARELAETTGDPYALGVCTYAEGMGHYLLGEWKDAVERLLEADRTFRESCAESPPEFRTLQACVVHSYWELGDFRGLTHRASRAVKEAEERGDIFTEATIRSGLCMQMHCIEDDAARGYEEATRTIDAWTGTGFDVQRYMYHVHSAFALLYQDRFAEAYDRIDTCVARSRTSMLAWVQLMRAGAYQARGLVTLARAAAEPEKRRRWVRSALADAKRMAKEDSLWARAGSDVIRGHAAALLGDRDDAIAWLDEAVRNCTQANMQGRADAARWAMGVLIGGPSGQAMIRSSREALAERGVRNPDRFVRSLSPILFLPEDDRPWRAAR